MIIYVIAVVVGGIIAGITLATGTAKAEGLVYNKLDIAGRITNIVLLVFYASMTPLFIFLGILSEPEYDGILGILGWAVAVIIASVPLYSGLGLGFSVSLRKKGKSKKSFFIQFAGLIGMAVAFIMFLAFYGNLLSSLN